MVDENVPFYLYQTPTKEKTYKLFMFFIEFVTIFTPFSDLLIKLNTSVNNFTFQFVKLFELAEKRYRFNDSLFISVLFL